MKFLLLIGIAGFFGTILRYACVRLINNWATCFPFGTLIVNIIGAFLAGFFFIFCKSKLPQFEAYFPLLFIGFLGAFTTFSTFALESTKFYLDAEYGKFIIYVIVQNISGLLAAGLGIMVAKLITR